MSAPLRFLFAGCVNAGKSTLINALIGKELLASAQDVCTNQISLISNLPAEAPPDRPKRVTSRPARRRKTAEQRLQCTFRTLPGETFSGTLIDTPGINAAMHPEYKDITQKHILQQPFDRLLYVLNAAKLGTTDDRESLLWIQKHVANDKVVFVVTQLDKFRVSQDDIAETLRNVRQDLTGMGFRNPVICPVSAWYGLLLKRQWYGETLSDDDGDELELYIKKFQRSNYDLSHYYPFCPPMPEPSESSSYVRSYYNSGMYGLESLLFKEETDA